MTSADQSPPLGGSRVLVVEDQERPAAAIRMALEAAGANVEVARSVNVACALLREQRFDAAIVDLKLRHADQGALLLDELERFDPHLHAFVLTGLSDRKIDETPLPPGVRILYKPASERDIVAHTQRAVRKTLRNRAAEDTAEPEVSQTASREDLPPDTLRRIPAPELEGKLRKLARKRGLSTRHQQMARGAVRDLTNAQIADWFEISPHTTHKFMGEAMRRAGIRRRQEFAWLLDRIGGEDDDEEEGGGGE